jgi:hypothetical protein
MPCFAACQQPAQGDFCAGRRDLGDAGTTPERRGRRLEPGPAGRGVAFVQPDTRRCFHYAFTVCRLVARMSAAAPAMFTTSAIQPTARDCRTRSRSAVHSSS